MWLKDEELYPRFIRSVLWITAIQYLVVTAFTLLLSSISWDPYNSILDFAFCLFHWKTFFYQCMLASTVLAFGVQNVRLFTVEKYVCATRFERIQRAFSLHCIQHAVTSMILGGLAAYCYLGLFNNFKKTSSSIMSLSLANNFEYTFITGHGCYTGLMFSFKYFICSLNHIKFSLSEEPEVKTVQRQIPYLLKDSFFSVLKAIHWYYLGVILFGSPLKVLTFSFFDDAGSIVDNMYYVVPHPKLFLSSLVSGTLIYFIWSLYILIFNAFATKQCIFPIKGSAVGKKITLSEALNSNSFGFIKYLAVLDLRTLAQYDVDRRRQIFAISNPGGHPHEWNAVSKICISSLQDFCTKLYEYSFSVAAESKASKGFVRDSQANTASGALTDNIVSKVLGYFRQKPVVAYFFDEIPNAKLMKLFASSQPVIWMIDALAYLVAFSYTEDQYGVVQQSLPDIIRLFLDLKMAEEKMPMGLVGIRTYVKDPQGRYDHVHQRLLLKTTVHNALSRIVCVYKDDIRGVYLPDDYQRYLERYLNQKT